jgi:DNA-binding transcriptional LysR family regulator
MKARKTIFDRSAQRPSLTEEGRRLFACASAMEQEAAGFLEGISSGTAGITVGFAGAAENPELFAFAQGFRRRHPDISLEFRKGTFEERRRQTSDSSHRASICI